MRPFLLFTASIAIITGFFLLNHNRSWMNERVLTYYREFPAQIKQMKKNDRMRARFGTYYTISQQIAQDLKKQSKNTGEDLVLLPATAYFKYHGLNYRVPEPVVFYYFTGIKTVWPDSEKAKHANWYVYVAGGQIHIDSVSSRQRLLDTIAAFNKFETSL